MKLNELGRWKADDIPCSRRSMQNYSDQLQASQWNLLIAPGGLAEWALTPSLPEPVKFLGCKMYGYAYKQYIFKSYNTSTFNAVRFDENPFTCHCEKEDKKA